MQEPQSADQTEDSSHENVTLVLHTLTVPLWRYSTIIALITVSSAKLPPRVSSAQRLKMIIRLLHPQLIWVFIRKSIRFHLVSLLSLVKIFATITNFFLVSNSMMYLEEFRIIQPQTGLKHDVLLLVPEHCLLYAVLIFAFCPFLKFLW